MANPNWNKNIRTGADAYKWANNFVQSYYNSPGFKQRLKENYYPEYVTPYLDRRYNYLISYQFVPKEKIGKDNNVIYEGMADPRLPEIGLLNDEYVFAHELGHNIDYLLSSKKDSKDYSERYPIFRKNKALQALLNNPKYSEVAKNKPNSLASLDDQTHDAQPAESYSDLIAMRDMLYRAGIYDSRKANNVFMKEHLKAFKDINPNFRLFKYFSDDDIITMMNEVAQNNISQDNQNLYAKRGAKLVPKKFKRLK